MNLTNRWKPDFFHSILCNTDPIVVKENTLLIHMDSFTVR